jgi:hypothetical protein
MQHRGTRLATLFLLLLTGALTAAFIWTTERGTRELDEQREAKDTTIDRLLSSISTITTAQQAYAENRRHDIASFTRVSVLINQITTDAAGLRPAGHSGTSSERLEEFWTALSALMGAESRARELFAGGDEASASEAILAAGREHVARLNSSLRAFHEAEVENYWREKRGATWRAAAALTATGAIWTAGLVLLAVVPGRRTAAETPAAAAPLLDAAPEPVVTAPAPPTPVSIPPSIDFTAAAALSTELSRLSDQAELTGLLGRAAEILDARGLVVWMGAGAELFAAAAYGYDAAVLRRIKPIAQAADNATASAWRTGQLRTVSADADGYGAIVAPLLSPSGCVGVLAAETRHGREGDAAVQALVTILASQLASVLAAWPAASIAAGETSDRKAAAS